MLELLEEFFYILIDWGQTLYNFLFTEIAIGNYQFRPIYALPVVGVALIILRILDQFTGG